MNPKQLLQHFDRVSEAPDAIPRLRRFILDLAVRGKLVEQDPNDEPAAELLKRLKKVVSRTAQKESKTDKHEADQPDYDIPSSWLWVRIGDHLELINGMAFKPTDWLQTGIKIVRIQNLNRLDAPFNYCDPKNVRDRFLIDDGAFLISWSGTPGTSFGAFIWDRGQAVLNQHIFRCDFRLKAFESRYLRLAINGRLDEMIAKAHGGVGLQHITKGKLEALLISLPPLAEQHRIVAKVDELMALCDQLQAAQTERELGRDRLVAASLHRIGNLTQSRHSGMDCRTNPPGADLHPPEGCRAGQPGMNPEHKDVNLSNAPLLRFDSEHQSAEVMEAKPAYVPVDWIPAFPAGMTVTDSADFVLQHLPRLTTRPAHIKQLRQTILNLAVRGKLVPQDPNDEPAAKLLKRIQAEKDRLIRDGKIREQKPLSTKSDDTSVKLPSTWHSVQLAEIVYLRSGIAIEYGDDQPDGEIPYVKVSDLNIDGNNKGILTSSRFIGVKYANSIIEPGSIVFPKRGGAIATNRKRATHVEVVCDSNLMAMRPFLHETAEFLQLWFSGFDLWQLNSGTSVPQINNKDIYPLFMPLPPLAEQHRIVAKVDELMALCDQLETQLNITENDSRRLLEAVLHEALAPALGKVA